MRLRTHAIYLASFMALCSTSTHAQIYNVMEGTNQISLSSDAIWLQQGGAMQISAISGSTVDIQETAGDVTNIIVSSPLQNLSMQGNTVTGWQIDGGYLQQSFEVRDFVSAPGSLGLSNIQVNLQTGLIAADVYTDTSGTVLNQAIWQFDTNQIQSSSSETPWDGDAVFLMLTVSLPQVTLTAEGSQWFKDGLHLEQIGDNFLNAAAADYGSMTLAQNFMVKSGTVITAVPEASTWAMMGLGLLGLAGLSRARSRQSSGKSA